MVPACHHGLPVQAASQAAAAPGPGAGRMVYLHTHDMDIAAGGLAHRAVARLGARVDPAVCPDECGGRPAFRGRDRRSADHRIRVQGLCRSPDRGTLLPRLSSAADRPLRHLGAGSQHVPVQHLPPVDPVEVASNRRRVPAPGFRRLADTEHLRVDDRSCDGQQHFPGPAGQLVRRWLRHGRQENLRSMMLSRSILSRVDRAQAGHKPLACV